MTIPCLSCRASCYESSTFCPSCGTHLQQANDPFVDRIIGRYKLVDSIGDGGCSNVYKAHHLDTGKRYAIKTLLPQYIGNDEMVERLQREARVLASLHHSNIVEVEDAGWSAGFGFYLVMEWLEGETVKDYLARHGPLSKQTVLYLFAQLLDALNTAHQQGVIHRDLKLDNLMLVQGGFGRTLLKVLDFGVAHFRQERQKRLTSTGLVVGTPRYMAPEQVRAENRGIDGRTDLYACGLMLHELLTGQPAFARETVQQLLYCQLNTMPSRLNDALPEVSFSEALEQVIQTATQKAVGDRYASAFDFYEALEQAMHREGERLLPSLQLPLTMPHQRATARKPTPHSVTPFSRSQTSLPATAEPRRSPFAAPSAPLSGDTRQRVAVPDSKAPLAAAVQKPGLFDTIAMDPAPYSSVVQEMPPPSFVQAPTPKVAIPGVLQSTVLSLERNRAAPPEPSLAEPPTPPWNKAPLGFGWPGGFPHSEVESIVNAMTEQTQRHSLPPSSGPEVTHGEPTLQVEEPGEPWSSLTLPQQKKRLFWLVVVPAICLSVLLALSLRSLVRPGSSLRNARSQERSEPRSLPELPPVRDASSSHKNTLRGKPSALAPSSPLRTTSPPPLLPRSRRSRSEPPSVRLVRLERP